MLHFFYIKGSILNKKGKKEKTYRRSSIGGQAVLEGVMMRGESSVATAVRTSSGEIEIETSRVKPIKERNVFFRLPFIRGIVNLCTQLFSGTAILLRSAEVYGDFAEPTKFENFVAKKFKINPMNLLMGFSVLLGLLLAIALFIVVPNFVTTAICDNIAVIKTHRLYSLWYSLIEGGLLLVIFIIYILLVTAMKDIRRVFMYHGAEHRTINCYEHGLELTVENAQKMSTAHSRCGTTFTFFVLAISIFVFALVNYLLTLLGWQTDSKVLNALIKIPAKLVFIPVIAGLAYELLKFLARFDNWFAKTLRAPGMLLQKLTTKKPTDDMVEVAIAAFKKVQEMDADRTMPTQKFNIKVPYLVARNRLKGLCPKADESDIDWLICETLGIKRDALAELKLIESKPFEAMEKTAKKMSGGMPLSYALGYTDFYGYKIAVNENVLIPRPETEELVMEALSYLDKDKSALDLCTGSGAIATVLKLKSDANVTASDVSLAVLDVAKANALNNGADVKFIHSNMFEKIDGKFDVIVSNPPYIESAEMKKLDDSVKKFEPHLALDGGEDGLKFYRIIANDAFDHLNENGVLLMEIGFNQAENVKRIFEDAIAAKGLAFSVTVKKDVFGNDRIVTVKR